jgi:hypothetical protein
MVKAIYHISEIGETCMRLDAAMKQMKLNQKLAVQCSPVLMGIKTANTITIKQDELEDILELLEGTGLLVLKLCECKKKCVLLLYRQNLLYNHIQREGERKFLASYGYHRDLKFDEILLRLVERFREYALHKGNFPHELGVFLEYPIKDMIGFIENKGKCFKLTGYWKVYENEEYAKIIFTNYDRAKEQVALGVEKGIPLWEIVRLYSSKQIAYN